jgi:hypothetical protein
MPCSPACSPSVSRPTDLILRPIAVDDAPAIFSGDAQDPSVVRFLSWRRTKAFLIPRPVLGWAGSGARDTVNLSGRLSRMQAICNVHWDLLPA